MIEEKSIPWQELIEVLFRRRRIILGVVFAAMIIAVTAVLLTPATYKATAKIRLAEEELSGPREEAGSKEQINTEIAFLRDPNLVHEVLLDYQRSQRPREPNYSPVHRAKKLGKKIIGTVIDLGPEEEDEVPSLHGDLRVAQEPGTNLIEVSYTTYDPKWAARFVNDFIANHRDRIRALSDRPQAGNLYHEEKIEALKRLREANDSLGAFRRENGASLLSGDETHLRRVLSDLEAERVRAETQILELAAKVQFLSAEISLHPDTIAAESKVTESESVKFLNSRVLELELQRSDLLSRYTPTSIRVQDIERQIEEAKRLLATKERETLSEIKTVLNPAYQALEISLVDTRSSLSAAEARVEALSSQIADYRHKLNTLESTAADLERFQTDVQRAGEDYDEYSKKEQEARFSSTLGEVGIDELIMVSEAMPPKEPQKDGKVTLLGGGLLAGLFFGIAAAFVKDWMDPSIKGSAQVYRLSGLPVIAEIPGR